MDAVNEKVTRNYTIEDLEEILDNIPVGVFLKDADGKYRYINKKEADRVGLRKDEIIGKYDIDIRGKKEAEECAISDKIALEEGEGTFFENKIVCGDIETESELYKTVILDSRTKEKLVCGSAKYITRDMSISNYIISKCTEIMDGSINSGYLYEDIIKKLKEIVNADDVALYLYDRKSNTMKIEVDLGNEEKVFPLEYVIGDKIKSKYYENDNYIRVKELGGNAVVYIYIIKHCNTLLGCIHIYYTDKPFEIKEKYIKYISLILSFMQNKKILKHNLDKELQMRSNSQKKLQLMIDSGIDYYALVRIENGKAVWLETSKKFNEVIGWTVEDLNSINCLELVKPKDRKKVENILSDYHKKTRKVCFDLLCKNEKWVSVSANLNYLADDIYMISANDMSLVTKLKKEKEKLQHIVELEGLKAEFFANMSHEFKTPINIILTTIQVISDFMIQNQKYPDSEKFYKYMASIKQNSFRLLKLANNMIDITKIDGGFFDINLGNYNIVEIVENIVQSVAVYIKDNKRNIIFDTREEEIITACDPNHIERIILNILSNAMKFTSFNGNIYVNIDMIDESKKIIIRIANDGESINIKDSKRIFERFTQSEHLMTRTTEGSGIGLSLVKSLVEMHDGEIYVNTDVKEGTEFCIELPIKEVVENSNRTSNKILNSKIERFHIEFSDIYN